MDKIINYMAALWAIVLIMGCGGGERFPPPDIYVNVFQDHVFPCLKVVFPDAVTYEGLQSLFSDNESALVYTMRVSSQPQYEIRITKRYTKSDSVEWMLRPIPEQYADAVTLYEILPQSGGVFERSAVLVLAEKDGDIYIRALIGEYVRPDTVFMITVDRLIQKRESRRLFSVDEWRNSFAGRKFISDMTARTDWYYHNTAVISCNGGSRVDRMWWE